MKKKLLCVVSSIAAISMLSGCTGFMPEQTQGGGNGEKVTISVGSWPTTGNALETRNDILELFNQEYGDQIEIVPDTWAYDLQTFLPKAASDQLPTIYHAYFTEAKRILDAGYAADITKQMEKSGYRDLIRDDINQIVERDGKTYLMPTSAYNMGILGNMKLMREAGLVDENDNPVFPKTYQELAEYAAKVTEKTGKAGFVFPTTKNQGGWQFTILAWGFGVDFMEEIDGKWKATFNTPECVEALQFIKDLKWKYNTLSTNAIIDGNEAAKMIATDQAAFYIADGVPGSLVKTYNMNRNDIAMGSIPAGPKAHATLVGGSFAAFSRTATPEQIDAGFKWLKYVGSTPEATDVQRQAFEIEYKNSSEAGSLIGLKRFTPWSEDAEINKIRDEYIDKYTNIDINHVKQYNDGSDAEIRLEEPVCCQDLYSILDSCIQNVLTDENANCEEIIANAARDFQANYLDNYAE